MGKVRFAVVGTNFISDWFCENALACDAASLEAVYSRKEGTGRAFAQKYGIGKVYTDYDLMLADADIDAVYVASPTVCHKEHSIKAMNAKKHVLCEKMIAENLSSFLEMKRTSLSTNMVLCEAMRPAYDPAYDRVREAVAEIGEVRRASFEFCQYSSRYDKFKMGIVENAFSKDLKNSALSDIGIYPLHVCISLFGEPKQIYSASVKLDGGFDGAGNILLVYDKMTAVVTYSKISDSVNPSLIEGEGGTVLIDKISFPKSVRTVLRNGEGREYITERPEHNMVYEIEAFCEMIRGERDYMSALELTERTVRAVECVYRASGIDYV